MEPPMRVIGKGHQFSRLCPGSAHAGNGGLL
jgi:hypothetical protein